MGGIEITFLVCAKCMGYYHLQENETLDDFLKCECGGTLCYMDELPFQKKTSIIWRSWGLGVVITIILGVLIIYMVQYYSAPLIKLPF